jgi:uncharacterized protein
MSLNDTPDTQSTAHPSRLANEQSAYLRSAAHQPVDWYPWGEEAFAKARELNKPILLDIGAVWCHWCHVIDRESYENEETAAIINDLYVAVKVDRDERPDVDARYQQAVQAISGQGGWPLTVFLTPDGDPFWGGTYFPPEDRYGRPGFPRVLREIAEFFRENRADAVAQGEQIRGMLMRTASSPSGAEPGPELVDQTVRKILAEHDDVNGGFGDQPKFPHPSAMDLLLRRYDTTSDENLIDVATSTLRAMARGGVYDQLAGGFHRYSVDARWVVPHFEKMLYDNAGLLRNYVWYAAMTGDKDAAEMVRNIVSYVDGILSDRSAGGFYSSQDADITLEDDGDYWTWTVEEAATALGEDEFRVMQRRYDIYERGEMEENHEKNVLFIAQSEEDIAAELDMPLADVERLLDSGRRRLLEARTQRDAPYVDTTIFVNWNAMMVVAYLDAARLLGMVECREFALATLDRLLETGRHPDGGMRHVLSESGDVPPTLDDQVQTGMACLAAYQTTGDSIYLRSAIDLADVLRTQYHDTKSGGFFDVPPNDDGVAFLAAPVKPVQDSPTASANGTAIQFCEQLGRITEDDSYRATAEETARAFAGVAPGLGLFGGAYALGLDQLIDPPPVAVLIGPAASDETRVLRDALLTVPRPGAVVLTLDPDLSEMDSIPAAVRGKLGAYNLTDGPVVFICTGSTCSLPLSDPDEAVRALMSYGKEPR